jgi:hypothetical protein
MPGIIWTPHRDEKLTLYQYVKPDDPTIRDLDTRKNLIAAGISSRMFTLHPPAKTVQGRFPALYIFHKIQV